MDVDFAQIRAFVTVADEGHFGRAADELALTQQGLSKRIQRLEQLLGEPLFVRNGRGIALTETGSRLLPHARGLLDRFDRAVATVRSAPAPSRPLRIDVFGPRFLDLLGERIPDLLEAATLRRSLNAAIRALQRNEIDAAFGRVRDLDPPLPAELTYRLVLLERHAVAVGVDHPLARHDCVSPADLAGYMLWFPADRDGSAELARLFRRYAEYAGMALDLRGTYPGTDTDPRIDTVHEERERLLLVPADRVFTPRTRLRLVGLDPAPCYPWSLVWRRSDPSPQIGELLGHFAAVGAEDGWLAYDPEHDWLPEPDRRDVTGNAVWAWSASAS